MFVVVLNTALSKSVWKLPLSYNNDWWHVFSIAFLLLHLLTCLKMMVMIGCSESIHLISDLEKVIFFSQTFNYTLFFYLFNYIHTQGEFFFTFTSHAWYLMSTLNSPVFKGEWKVLKVMHDGVFRQQTIQRILVHLSNSFIFSVIILSFFF